MILAIDPSLKNTALVIGDEAGFTMFTASSKPNKDSTRGRIFRYELMVSEIIGRIEEYCSNQGQRVSRVFIEGYSYGSVFSMVKTAEYGGLIRWHLLDLPGIPEVIEVAPTTLKKFCTGKGNSNKLGVALSLQRRYQVNFETDDEYDAYGLFELGLCCTNLRTPANDKQRECVRTVLNGLGNSELKLRGEQDGQDKKEGKGARAKPISQKVVWQEGVG